MALHAWHCKQYQGEQDAGYFSADGYPPLLRSPSFGLTKPPATPACRSPPSRSWLLGAGILSFMGQVVYRKADIQCAMERAYLPAEANWVEEGERRRECRTCIRGRSRGGGDRQRAMKKASASWMRVGSEPPIEPINTRSPRYQHHLNELDRIRRKNEMAEKPVF